MLRKHCDVDFVLFSAFIFTQKKYVNSFALFTYSCFFGVQQLLHYPFYKSDCTHKRCQQIFSLFLLAAVEEVKLKDTQYTLDHMRAFGMYNYLHLDPWYEDSVLFVDCKGRVLSLTVTLVSL